jgi:hypothetical protein
MGAESEPQGPERPLSPGAALDALTAPLRSRTESFPFYGLGGLLYVLGAVLVLYGAQGPLAEVAEVVLLLGGSAVVLYAYLIDRGTLTSPLRSLL